VILQGILIGPQNQESRQRNKEKEGGWKMLLERLGESEKNYK